MSIWTNLPKGKVTNEWEGYDSGLPSVEEYVATDLIPKTCTCGAEITYGKDVPLEFHSIDVCDLHIKEKKDERS